MMEEVKMKKCTTCGEVKPITEFGVRTNGKRKYPRSECKKCCLIRVNRWNAENPEKSREYRRRASARQYLKTHPDCKPYGIRQNPCCHILKEHHELMKDDPEHLTTEFLKKLTKCSCKVDITE